MDSKFKRVYLDVPFNEKDEAKKLGAWWDPEVRKWFVPNGISTTPFERWFQKAKESQPERATFDQ